MNELVVLLLLVILPGSLGWGLIFHWRRARAAAQPATWLALVIGNGLLLLFLVSIGLLGGELYVRFCYDATDSLGYTKISQRWVARHWQNNSASCRDNIQYYPAKAADKRRITFLGDSFTAGHGIKDVENRFANLLRREHPNWEIHALAQPGYDTQDEIDFLQSCLNHHYVLDVVVLVYCLNDVSDLVPNWAEARNHIYAEADRPGWLKDNSYFFNLLYHRYHAMRNPWMTHYFEFVRDTASGPIWEAQRKRLDSLRRLVTANHGRLLVVTFPFLHALGPGYPFQSVHNSLDAFWREQGIPHCELLSVFRELSPAKITVNRFDAHPNELAHALAADAISSFLEKQLATQN